MRAGKLDRLIDIQRKTATESPSGEPVESWNNIATKRPASYWVMRGDERFGAPQLVAEQQVEFRIRYSADMAALTAQDRIVYPAMNSGDAIPAGRLYDILSVAEIGRSEGIAIITKRRADVS